MKKVKVAFCGIQKPFVPGRKELLLVNRPDRSTMVYNPDEMILDKSRGIDRLPRFRNDDFLKEFIKEKVKEGLREGMKDLMKEAFNEFLGDKKVKEIREERQQEKRDAEKVRDNAEWTERFRAKMDLEKENPTMFQKEAADLLGINSCTLANYAKAKHIKGEYIRGNGWSFKKKEVLAFQGLLMPQIYKRRAKKYGSKQIEPFQNEYKSTTWIHRNRQDICPLTPTVLVRFCKKGLLEHKKINAGKRWFYYIKIEHLKTLMANPPGWLKKSLLHGSHLKGVNNNV